DARCPFAAADADRARQQHHGTRLRRGVADDRVVGDPYAPSVSRTRKRRMISWMPTVFRRWRVRLTGRRWRLFEPLPEHLRVVFLVPRCGDADADFHIAVAQNVLPVPV